MDVPSFFAMKCSFVEWNTQKIHFSKLKIEIKILFQLKFILCRKTAFQVLGYILFSIECSTR